jgi:hypothetical protein
MSVCADHPWLLDETGANRKRAGRRNISGWTSVLGAVHRRGASIRSTMQSRGRACVENVWSATEVAAAYALFSLAAEVLRIDVSH